MFITATGMVCSVGLSAASACAAKRAGIAAFSAVPYMDSAGEYVVGAPIPTLDPASPRASRLLDMLEMALEELVDGRPDLRWGEVPVLICLPESGGPGEPVDWSASVVERLQNGAGIGFDRTLSRSVPHGRTAAFNALRRAKGMIDDGRVPACVVCGVDSLLAEATLLRLERTYRLKTSTNRDGLIPGEAAAAVLIERHPHGEATAEVTGLGFGQEDASILAGKPLLGLGLSAAARAALAEAGVGLHEIDLRLSDVTGELYGFKELALMEGRLMRVVRKAPQPVWHWAEAIGDTGAVAGIAQLVLVDQAFRKRFAPGNKAICLTSSTNGERAVAIIQDSGR